MRSRTSSRHLVWRGGIVAVLVALVVLVVRGTRRQRTILQLVAALTFRFDIPNPVDVVGGWFGSVANDVYQFVRSAIGWLVDQLTSFLNGLVSNVWQLFSSVASGLSSLGSWAAAAISQVAQSVWAMAASVENTVRGWVDDAIHTAWNLAGSVLDTARGWVDSLASNVLGLVGSVLDTARNLVGALASNVLGLVGSVLDTARGWVDDAIRGAQFLFGVARDLAASAVDDVRTFLVDYVTRAVSALLQDVGHLIGTAFDDAMSAIRDAITELGSKIGDVTDYVGSAVTPFVGLIESVADWLVALATLPFSEFRDAWDAFRSARGPDVLGHVDGFMQRGGSDALAHFKDYAAG